jgi:plastocyanin
VRSCASMRRAITASIACAALAVLTGCGSSSSSSTSTSTTTSSTAAKTSSSAIKANTTPQFGSPPASAPVQSGLVQIAYRNIAISPDTLKVKVGATIRWRNFDSIEHNVTSAGGAQRFASKNFGEGASFSIKAEKPGVIHYLCTIHPTSMNGTIEVLK